MISKKVTAQAIGETAHRPRSLRSYVVLRRAQELLARKKLRAVHGLRAIPVLPPRSGRKYQYILKNKEKRGRKKKDAGKHPELEHVIQVGASWARTGSEIGSGVHRPTLPIIATWTDLATGPSSVRRRSQTDNVQPRPPVCRAVSFSSERGTEVLTCIDGRQCQARIGLRALRRRADETKVHTASGTERERVRSWTLIVLAVF